jgi:hypothetical protein
VEKLMTAIRLGLHLHPPPRQRLDAFVDTVKREDRYGFANVQDDPLAWQRK